MQKNIMDMCYLNPLTFRLFYHPIYLLQQKIPANTAKKKKAEVAVKAMLLWLGELLILGIIAAIIFICINGTAAAMMDIWNNTPIIKVAKIARDIYEKIPGVR